MNRYLLILTLLLLTCGLFALPMSVAPGGNTIELVSSSPAETVLKYHIATFETEQIQIAGQTWHHISLPDEGHLQLKGEPQLPVVNRSIIIDGKARMKLEVYDVEYTDLKLAVAPSKGVITRDIDPKSVPYEFGTSYLSDSFYPSDIATLSDPYILRDFRGITVQTTPFAYKADTQTLRVYTTYKVRVYSDGIDTVNTLNQSRESVSRSFSPLYQNHFVNWPGYRYTPVDDSYGKLLVVCHSSFMTAIQPWVNWKRQKGIETELVEWSTIGTTAAQLQTYIQNKYNQDNSLTFVQLVGDAPQIPSLSSGGGGSDPTFSLVAGSDNYPDIFIGRFSAQTLADLSPQINRSIAYERDATTTDTWLSQAMGIASNEGGGSQGDNGESDIAHMNNIRSDLLGYGYTSVDQIYDPGASAATVSANVNAGRGFINYVGHGSDTAWSTTGFSVTNATALTNGYKSPFIVDVACVNGNFVSMTCFAEGWMRSSNGGAITIYASTINQSWNSPMRAQDEITDLWVAETKSTAGGFYYSGSCKMMDIYGTDGVNMFKTWHIFGDASLMARSKTPLPMTVTHPNQIIIGASSMNISTGVPNALVALTSDNHIYARGTTDDSGNLSLTLSGLPSQVISFTLTVTAYNRVTYIGAVQQVTTPANPRFVAEWEPAQGAIVRYPFGQPYSLLQDLAENSLLYVLVTETLQGTAHANLQANGIDMGNVRYINAPTDSYWIRDYGPWSVFDDELNLHLVDFTYNRPRPNDDAIPPVVADYLDLGLYDLDMNHTGGNVMTDGMGKAMSTELVLSENSSLSQAEIDQRFSSILGVTDYQIYTDPTATYIDHIDCWAKLLDVDKVIIRRVPSSHAQYAAIENSVAQWQAKTSSYGTPYRIFRVDTPNNEPYTNSFIMNGNIYVPQMGTTNDAAALAVYQTAMPGFTVRGYSFGTYQSTDALHCRVNTIFDDQMIAVRHTPIDDLTSYQEYTLMVEIDHHNSLNAETSFIAWSTSSSGPWQQSSLSHVSGSTYSASFTSPAHLQSVYYWIQATDTTGRSTKLPLCGALDPFVANVTVANPNLPNWTPVSYPNPPATIHAQISFFGNPALEGDLVGAFVNGECRGTGVVSAQRNGYVTMQVQLAASGETVNFRIYSQADGQAYDTDLVINPAWGETIGEDSPVTLVFTLDKPVVSINQDGSNLVLSWPEVTNADGYQILAAHSPDGEFSVISTITGTSYQINATELKCFFKVIAVKGNRLQLKN